jgi:hypothetical protein
MNKPTQHVTSSTNAMNLPPEQRNTTSIDKNRGKAETIHYASYHHLQEQSKAL